MSFQKYVNIYPAVGVAGARASQNPVSTVDAGQLGLRAGSQGTYCGAFAWITYAVAGGAGVTGNSTLTGAVPDGFVWNEMNAVNTVWLEEAGMLVPPGYGTTLVQRGDFWVVNAYADAAIGQKVFANVFTGAILGAAAGSFPTNEVGTAAVIASATTGAVGTYTLTINTLTSGVVEVGDQVLGLDINGKVYIESFNTFNGTSGSVNLTLPIATVQTAVALTTIPPTGVGGAVVSSASAAASSTTVTINTLTSGTIVPGQLVQGTSVPTGAVVASLGTFNGTSGTIILSAAVTATITAAALNFSAFVETPWYVTAAGNVGDLVKIGIKN